MQLYALQARLQGFTVCKTADAGISASDRIRNGHSWMTTHHRTLSLVDENINHGLVCVGVSIIQDGKFWYVISYIDVIDIFTVISINCLLYRTIRPYRLSGPQHCMTMLFCIVESEIKVNTYIRTIMISSCFIVCILSCSSCLRWIYLNIRLNYNRSSNCRLE